MSRKYSSEEKREYFKRQMDELKETIEEKINDFLDNSEELKNFISFRRKHFHSYSLNNTLLIYRQCPMASYIAGFNKWKELGYRVKKGAKAIHILIPLIRKERGKASETEKDVLYGFKRGNVFDLSQVEATKEAQKLPSIDTGLKLTKHVTTKPDQLLIATESFIEQHCPIIESGELGSAMGMTNGKEIYIKPNTNRVDTAGILVHEFCHYWNHFKENRRDLTKNHKESEAELTTLIFGSFFSLNTEGTYKYLAMYRKERELATCFETAYSTFEYILDGSGDCDGLEMILEKLN